MIRFMRFLPAIVFLLLWVLVITKGLDMKRVEQAPITSDQFINTIGQCIDNPLTHNSALRAFFIRLRQAGAPARIWADSQPFGWELWNQYQYVGGIEIMLLIAHESGNRLEERYWAKKYTVVAPNDSRVRHLIEQLRSSPPGNVPVGMLGPW